MIDPVTCTGNKMGIPQIDPWEDGVKYGASYASHPELVASMADTVRPRTPQVLPIYVLGCPPIHVHFNTGFPMGRIMIQETNGSLLEYRP